MVDNGTTGRASEAADQNKNKEGGVLPRGIVPDHDRANITPVTGDSGPGGLTSIHVCIHCPDTEDVGSGEMENLAIEGFLDALAQVSLSIVSRTDKDNESSSLHPSQ